MAFDIGPYLSGGRNVVSALAGVAAGVGISSVGGVSTADVVSGFDHIFNGLNQIAIGVGILAPAAMAVWAGAKGRLASKVADVNAAAPAELAKAVAQAAPAVILDAAANTLGTTQIRTTPELAKATESPKVVATSGAASLRTSA